MNKFIGVALAAVVFASCESSGNNRVSEPTPAAPATFTPPAATTIDLNNQPATNSTPTAPAGNTTNAVALNPAHGAPGHRCEIPVGAPLNSAAVGSPAATGTNSITPAPQIQIPAQPSGNTVRLNPAHGAPGHDCSIPVGQPLKS